MWECWGCFESVQHVAIVRCGHWDCHTWRMHHSWAWIHGNVEMGELIKFLNWSLRTGHLSILLRLNLMEKLFILMEDDICFSYVITCLQLERGLSSSTTAQFCMCLDLLCLMSMLWERCCTENDWTRKPRKRSKQANNWLRCAESWNESLLCIINSSSKLESTKSKSDRNVRSWMLHNTYSEGLQEIRTNLPPSVHGKRDQQQQQQQAL